MEITVTDENFETEVVQKSYTTPVLVDFWASWCGPCRILGPVIEKIAETYKSKLIVAKMSVEENSQIPNHYRILSIPSVKLFKNGTVVAEFLGARPFADVKEFVDAHV